MIPKALHFCGISDIGLSRPTNQDVWTANPEFGFFALADGIGGRKAGDIAAKEALNILCESIRRLSDTTDRFHNPLALDDEIRAAIKEANRWVYKMSCESLALQGMGTTLCCLLWTSERVYYAHVGDSRIYRFRNEKLELLTRDHSLLARWLSKKRFTQPLPPKNIITRAIGTARFVDPEISFCPYVSGDIYMLCSDGLSDVVSKDDLQKILRNSSSMERAAKKMIESAKKMGSGDNITVLIISSPDFLPDAIPQEHGATVF